MMQISDAIDDYLETLRCTRRPRTLESATQILNEFRARFGTRKLAKITRRELLTYIEGLGKAGNSQRTKANKFIRIVAMFRHHDITIARKGDRPKFTRKMPQVYEPAELETFFAACDARQKAFFSTLLMTGIRMSEAKFLEWGDLRNGILHVQPHPPHFVTKTHEERKITVPTPVWELLHSMKRRPGKLVFPTKSGAADRHMLRHVKRIAQRARLNAAEWWLHKFRASFCTKLARSGVDLETVRKQMGHSSILTTMRYLRAIEPEQLRGRIDHIWGGTPGIVEGSYDGHEEGKAALAPLTSSPPATREPDLTDGVVFYEEPEPPKRNGNGNGNGNGSGLRHILSPTELEILRLMVIGKTGAEIARDLGTTENAVKMRVNRMLVKTRCRDRLQLAVRYARENLDELRAAAGVL